MTVGTITLVSDSDDVTGSTNELALGGKYGIITEGTFDSATLKLQVSADGTNWVDEGYSVTAADAQVKELSYPYIRAVISGSTTAASLTCTLHPVI